MSLSNFIPDEIISALGWTIVHSLWQGIVVAILLSILLVILSKSSAKIRSYISYAALIILVAASVKTFSNYYEIKTDQTENIKTLEQFILNESEINSSEITTQNLIAEFEDTSTFVIESLGSFFQNNLRVIVSIWVVGILFFFIRLLGGFVYTQRVKHYKTFEVDNIWTARLQNLADKIQIQKKVQLVESAIIKLPMVIGYFKPIILIPIATITGLPQNQIEAILAHELAHIKREDYFLNIIQSIIEILFFFNPAVWWISSTIRKEREYSCDELAIETCGDSMTLAKALLAIQQQVSSKPIFALAAIGNKSTLISRINKMLNINNNKLVYPKRLAVIIFLFVSLGLITAAACSSNIDDINNNELNNTPLEIENEPVNFSSIASPAEPVLPAKLDDEVKRKTISFHEHENGDEVHWKVVTENGEIVELYKDGEKLSDEEMKENEDHIIDKLAEIEEGFDEIDFDELHESLQDLKFNFKFDFDDKNFAESMKHVKESLKHLRDNKFHFEFDFDDDMDFDSESFREGLRESLKELDHMNFEFDFDKEDFKEGMREFRKNMKDFKVDMSEFKANMKNFVDMSKLKSEMKELKVELKKLDGFLDETKSELIKDGYVDEDAEDYEMELHEDEMIVNGKKLPDDLHKKYLTIYKKHFDKKLVHGVCVR